MTILINSIGVVFWRNVTGLSRFTVAAETHRTATNAVIPTSGLVNRTSFISDVIMMNPFVCVVRISTVAAIVFLFTGNQNLGSDVNVGPGSLAVNFDSV
jgi:uncharacterized membrane protein HdeD (DUF308 family)